MFGRKSIPKAPGRSSAKISLTQLGLMGIPDMDTGDDDDDGDLNDDSDLEAELLALTSGGAPKSRKSDKPVVSHSDFNRMVAESLRDLPSDEELSSGDDDPSLLAELQELQVESKNTDTVALTPTSTDNSSIKSTLIERLKMYEAAEHNARATNDTSKARRMARGISNLKDLIRRADAGASIDENDIPPAVSMGVTKNMPLVPPRPSQNEILNISDNASSSPPAVPARTVKHSAPTSPVDDEPEPKMKPPSNEEVSEPATVASPPEEGLPKEVANLDIAKRRHDDYKTAALAAKRKGDMPTALNYVKIVKQLERVIQEAQDKLLAIDPTLIPPPLTGALVTEHAEVPTERSNTELQHDNLLQSSDDVPRSPAAVTAPATVTESYTAPTTVMEALEERLKKYQEAEEAAKREENASKSRRMGRIVQQYKKAIQLHKAGRPIPVDELPTPPGFAPIPVGEPSKEDTLQVPSEIRGASPKTVSAATSPNSTQMTNQKMLPQRDQSSNQSVSRSEKQMRALMERQKLFKSAALKAKQEGDLEAAKEYLRSAKGFDPLIEASKCGLPVDFSSLPLPPNEKQALDLDSSYEAVRLNDCIEGTDLDVFQKLTSDLQRQLEMCVKTRDNFKAMGDIANANRLEQLASRTKKDLKFVQLAEMSNLRVPKFHYETKPFTIVQCNTDLTDNDVEVTVVQGINYNVPNPKAVDTYVKLTFPYPENAQQYKTAVIYDTNNPSYNATTTFTIQRNARSCRRIFVRNALKCEIWSKNGIFRSDSLIGTVNVKLQPLETQCTIHDAYDLMDGRRAVGGKLELKIRIRDPITRKQIEQIEEKWLIIDS